MRGSVGGRAKAGFSLQALKAAAAALQFWEGAVQEPQESEDCWSCFCLCSAHPPRPPPLATNRRSASRCAACCAPPRPRPRRRRRRQRCVLLGNRDGFSSSAAWAWENRSLAWAINSPRCPLTPPPLLPAFPPTFRLPCRPRRPRPRRQQRTRRQGRGAACPGAKRLARPAPRVPRAFLSLP